MPDQLSPAQPSLASWSPLLPPRPQVSALRFAEAHRRLVNVLVHAHPALLTTSLQALMRMPRLLDFDNK